MTGPYAEPADLQIICLLQHKAAGDTYQGAAKDTDQHLSGILSALRNRGEFVGELGHISFPAAEHGALALAREDPALMGDQTRRAWEDWLDAETRARPIAILLEDLHWGDRATVAYLEAALRHLAERPLLLVGVGRPELHELYPRLGKGRGAVEIHLWSFRWSSMRRLRRAKAQSCSSRCRT